MEKLFTSQPSENATEGAIDLMAKLAVLIVAGLLFAGYGIREGRTQPMASGATQAATPGNPERVVMLRRLLVDPKRTAPAPTTRTAPVPVDRF